MPKILLSQKFKRQKLIDQHLHFKTDNSQVAPLIVRAFFISQLLPRMLKKVDEQIKSTTVKCLL